MVDDVLYIFNGVSIIPEIIWTKPDIVLAIDACLEGARGVYWERKELFHFTLPHEVLCENHHIRRLELAVLTVAVGLDT